MKKALSLLLVLAMVLSMVPAVFAEEAAPLTSIDGLKVAANTTVTYTYAPEVSCKLDLKTVGDAAVYVNDTLILGDVIEMPVDGWEGTPDVSDDYGDTASEVQFDAGTSYVIKMVGYYSATTLSVEKTVLYGSEAWPIDLNADLLYENDFSATVNVAAGATVYYTARVGGMILTINDGEGTTLEGDPNNWPVFSVYNDTDAAADYVLKVAYPVGTQSNPDTLVIGENKAVIEAGSQGYYYTWTAHGTGTLSITMPDGDWFYVINNLTTYAYGDSQWSDSDPVANPATVEVTEGDVLEIVVNTYDPADMWNNPAGTLVITAEFTYPLGSEQNPIDLTVDLATEGDFSATVTVAAGETVYYQSYNIAGMNMSINGGEATAVTGNPRAPYVWSITNNTEADAEYVITVAYPIGNQANPDTLVIGENVASIEAGSQGYYYTYTATEDGTLSIAMPEGDWTYVINNTTAGTYGDTQWSDSDPLVNPGTVEVAAGDVIQIIVNTYNPADMWSNPAGNITVTASFEAAVAVDEALVFYGTPGLSFQEYIGINLMMKKSVYQSHDKVYIVAVQADPAGDVTETIEGVIYGSYVIFDKQVLAWSMTENVTLTLYGETDGVLYQGQSITTNIETLALEKIAAYNTAGNANACRALVDMLNYGAAVQVGYDHNASSLPNANLGEYASLGTSDDPTFSKTNSNTAKGAVTVVGHSVSMQAKVEIQFMFKVSEVSGTDYVLRSTVGDATTEIPVADFDVYGNYAIARVAVKAANMREDHTIALYNAEGEAVTAVYTSSVEAYASAQVGGTYNDVVMALLKYGDSVAAL